MAAKLLLDIPTMNWAYTVVLERGTEYTFGTAKGNTFVLPPRSASEWHAQIAYQQNGWVVSDCAGDMGVTVNGMPIKMQALRDQDVLRIGACEAVFQNPEEATGKSEWNHTLKVAEHHQSTLKPVVDKAASGQIAWEELERALQPRGTGALESFAPSNTPVAHGSRSSSSGESSGDLVWVAQKLAAIMSEVLSHPATREESYRLMLQQLREAIDADNGFVMIPDTNNMRWIIRAWVGDSASWSQYERNHPLPLTITNRAFRTMGVVSNALAESGRPSEDEPINSISMQHLNVSSYIAVPLVENKQRRGVLYFDTRSSDRKFRSRDVKLLELVGHCILEIEDQRK